MQQLYRSSYSYRKQIPRQTQRRLARDKLYMAAAGFVVVLIGLIFINGHKDKGQDGNVAGAQAATSSEKAATQEQPKKQVDTSALQPGLDAILKKYSTFDTSVAIVDLNSGKTITSGDSYPYVAASTTKLLTALLYLNNVESGQESLSTNLNGVRADELLKRMINQSDNDAWKTINDDLTRDSLSVYAKKIGLNSYDQGANTITASDMSKLLAMLHNGTLIDQQHTKMLYSWMQNTSEERFMVQDKPSGTNIYHKAGYLNDRIHDVGIVDNGSTPFVIVIYSKTFQNADYDTTKGQAMFKEIMDLNYQIFK